jgi:hypothetical protein
MTRRRRHPRVRISFRARYLSLLGAMVVSAPAFLASSIPATAFQIMYMISPSSGATANFPPLTITGSGTLTITGGFSFDPEPGTGPGTEGPTLVSADITAEKAPPTSILIQRMVETFDSPVLPVNSDAFSIVAEASATGDAIKINFATPLGITPDDITEVMVFNNNTLLSAASAPFGSVTGQAIPISVGAGVPIPEPASLSLLGGALGLFLLTRRAKRRPASRA